MFTATATKYDGDAVTLSTRFGGGIYNDSGDSISLTEDAFANDLAGGGAHNTEETGTMTDLTFSEDLATGRGGALSTMMESSR